MSSTVSKLGPGLTSQDWARLRLKNMIAECSDRELLRRICEDAKLCRNMLSDYCPGPAYRRERELLVAVVADRGEVELHSFQSVRPDEAAIRRLIRRMVDGHGFMEEGVKWAVESWLLALGFQGPELEFSAIKDLYSGPLKQPSEAPKSLGGYDVFICYRRDSAPSEARLIRSELRARHIRAFVDVADLKVEMFDKALLKRIVDTPIFIVLLTPNCFDRCAERKDWFRQEIGQALKNGRKIIQIVMPGFEFPANLPHSIRELSRCNPRLTYSNELLDEVIERIVRYVNEERQLRGVRLDPNTPPEGKANPKSKYATKPEGSAGMVEGMSTRLRLLRNKLLQWRGLRAAGKWALVLTVLTLVAVALWLYRPLPPVDYSNFTVRRTLPGSTAVQSIAFSSDQKILASTGADKTIRMWDVGLEQPKGSLGPFEQSVVAVVHSMDEKNLLAIGYPPDENNALNSQLVIEDAAQVKQRARQVVSFAVSSDGKTVAGGNNSGTVSFWDIQTGNLTGVLPKDSSPQEHHYGLVRSVTFSPDGKTLASGGKDSNIILWDWKTGISKRVLKRHTGSVNCLAFSPDSEMLASGGQDNQVIVWNVGTGDFAPLRASANPVISVAFSPDGKTVAAGDNAGKFYFWELQDKTWQIKSLSGYDGMKDSEIGAFSFSSDGKILALGHGSDIQLWGEK